MAQGVGTADRAAWLEARRRGIGGTDAAAILGLSPWASPLTVWLDKRGELPARDDDEAEWLWWGRNLEELIARRYVETTGRAVYNPGRILTHTAHEFLIGTPDLLCVDEPRGVDIKTARRGDDWGAPRSDDIPPVYIAQMCHYMAIADVDVWDVAVLVGGSDFRVYTIQRDREFESVMIEKLVAWWQRHMVGDERPDLDGSEVTRAWLGSRYPIEAAPFLRSWKLADDLAAELAQAREATDQWAERKTECENKLKDLIGEAAGIEGEGWRATWKRTRGRRSTDFESMAAYLTERLVESGVPVGDVERFTNNGAGHRRFTFTQRKIGGSGGGQ